LLFQTHQNVPILKSGEIPTTKQAVLCLSLAETVPSTRNDEVENAILNFTDNAVAKLQITASATTFKKLSRTGYTQTMIYAAIFSMKKLNGRAMSSKRWVGSQSSGFNEMLDQTFHMAMTDVEAGPLSQIQRTLDRMRRGAPLHSGSFLSNRDSRRKRHGSSTRLVSEPRFIPRILPREFDCLEVPAYEPVYPARSSQLPQAADEPPEIHVRFGNIATHTPPSPMETRSSRAVPKWDPPELSVSRTQADESDSFELEAHQQLLDEVGQFIAAHDFEEEEEAEVEITVPRPRRSMEVDISVPPPRRSIENDISVPPPRRSM
jgi:hypothetical protein